MVQAEWMRYLSLVVEQKYGRVQDVCRQADEADRGRMRKGRMAGAYAGRVRTLLKQGESRWEPDVGASVVI